MMMNYHVNFSLFQHSLGSAFHYFLLSCLLLCIGSAVRFDSWINVYDIHTNDLQMGLLRHIRRDVVS